MGVALSVMLSCAHAQELPRQDQNTCRDEAGMADLAAIQNLEKLQRDAANAGMSVDEYRQATMMLRILNLLSADEETKWWLISTCLSPCFGTVCLSYGLRACDDLDCLTGNVAFQWLEMRPARWSGPP